MNWLNLGMLLALSAGWAKLLACGLNRLQTRPWSHESLARARLVHDFFLLGYPLALYFGLVRNGPEILTGGSWLEIAWPWSPVLLAGAVGIGLLINGCRETYSYRRPRCVVAETRTLHDLTAELGARPFAYGPVWPLALLPGNEQFTLDVVTYQIELPGLPAAWDGLSIVQLSDLHFRGAVALGYFEQVCEIAAELQPDLFIFTGDLLDRQALSAWIPTTLGRLRAPLGNLFILGNHDWYLDSAATRKMLVEQGWTDIAGRVEWLERNGAALQISGLETPWMGTEPNLHEAGTSAGEPFRLLVSHTPDHWPWAVRQGVQLMLAGHTHGGQVRLPILGPVYAPSRFGCRFSAGLFWFESLLLVVSRGISGREPLRYGCPPELIKLVLKRPQNS